MSFPTQLNAYKDLTASELPLNRCENLDDLVNEISNELTQIEWAGLANCLRINPEKLHLVTSSSGCDLQRQKSLGILCWIEDEPRVATFEKLISALTQIEANSLSNDVRSFCRLLRMRKASMVRKMESLQTQYYAMQLSPGAARFGSPGKSQTSHGQWKFTEMQPHFLYSSPTVAFYPSRSVPSNPTFDLTNSVSVQGAKLRLIHRGPLNSKQAKKAARPSTIATCKLAQSRKRPLGNHRKSADLGIHTSIKTAVPLTNNLYRDCHPEEIQEKISEKFFDYLLNENGSKEVLSTVSSLESIDGVVVKKLRKGSLKIDACIHKVSALKVLVGHFESGQLNEMFQEQLLSTTALQRAGAFTISLETSIDRKELDSCLHQLAPHNRTLNPKLSQHTGRIVNNATRGNSPTRSRISSKSVGRNSFGDLHMSSHYRTTSVPGSRSVVVELSPSVRTVRPEPRENLWRTDKLRLPAKNEHQAGVVFDETTSTIAPTIEDTVPENEQTSARQSVPPPSPDITQDLRKVAEKDLDPEEEEIKVALDDLHKRTQEAQAAYRKFDKVVLRRFVDSLKNAPSHGVEKISHVGDLRKYATILRTKDAAETAQLVEEFVNVTESLDQIHRDVTSKIWLKVSDCPSASAKSRDSTGSYRRSPLRNQVTQSIEIWRQMQDPKYDFTGGGAKEHGDPEGDFTLEETKEYGGLLAHIPALLLSANSCYELLNHYMHAP